MSDAVRGGQAHRPPTTAAATTPRAGFYVRLRRIAALAGPYRWRIALGIALVLASTALSLVFPLGVAAVIDTAVRNGELATLNRYALGVLAAFLSMVALGTAGTFLLKSTGERLILDLRETLFAHLHSLDVEFFHQQRLGDLTSRLNVDTTAVRGAVTDTAVSIVTQCLMLAGSAAVMIAINWRLALLVLALAPATTLLSRAFGPRLQDTATEVQADTADSLAVAQESMAGIAVVKTLSRAPYESRRYGASVGRLLATTLRFLRMEAWFAGLVALMSALLTVGLFWYGGLQVLERAMTAGALVAFLFYAQNISQSFATFAHVYGDLNMAIGALARIFEILDLSPSVADAVGAAAPVRSTGHIRIERVGFAYGEDRPVLHGIDLDIAPGQIVALVGRSGSGKSTVAQLLPRLFDPSQGRILLDGRDIRELPLAWLRERVALVSQDVFLFGGSIRDNIRYGRLEATDEQIEAAARAAAAHEFVADLAQGYDTQIGERGVKLSGGQRQRLALARSFLRDPQLLILDEITSAVDGATERKIQQAILDWNRERKVAILVIAHRLSAMRIAHRTVVMEHGRIVEEGASDELLDRKGRFYDLMRTSDNGAQADSGEREAVV